MITPKLGSHQQPPSNVINQKALVLTLSLFLALGAAITAVIVWAKNDAESKVAEQLRSLIGIPHPGTPQKALASAKPTHQPIVAPEPPPAAPIPEPVIRRDQLSWKAFATSHSMWPNSLEVVIDKAIPVRFRTKNIGEMVFESGQKITVSAITDEGQIIGSINSNEISISYEATNLASWFDEKYGQNQALALPSIPASLSNGPTTEPENNSDQELLYRMRLWAVTNYDTPLFELTDNAIVLKWSPKEEAEIDFRLEAREIARKYLMLGADLGTGENYANCEIRDPATNELLGSNGIFIPKL